MTPERKAELRDLAKCRVCSGKGRFDPHCWRCDDSGDDHECPPERVCDACSSTGKDPRQTEMLDEIDRLEGLVREAHDLQGEAWTSQLHFSCTCEQWEMCVDEPDPGLMRVTKRLHEDPTIRAEHAAHVEAILRGDT